MPLSADRHPGRGAAAAAVTAAAASLRRAGPPACRWAALISVNFACNSCLIADRTIAIRRRFAAVMRTKSGRSSADAGASTCSAQLSLSPAWRVSVGSAVRSCPAVARKLFSCFVRCGGFPGGAIDDTVTTIVGRDETGTVGHLVPSMWPRLVHHGN